MTIRFVTKHEIAELLHLSPETLKKYRATGRLVEGIHWIRINSRVVRYNRELIQDLVQNIADPVAHQRAIEAYQLSLLSNKKKVRQPSKGVG